MTHDTGEGYGRLWNGLVVAGLDPTGSFRWDERRSPYPGLLAYDDEDAAVFFGRDETIREALDTLNTLRRFSGRRLVLFLGASGSGKSSLVRAGLAPRLKRDMESWIMVDPFRPRQRPFDGLAAMLAKAFEHHGEIRDRKALADQLKRAAQQSPPMVAC
jgi:hypothetical protein